MISAVRIYLLATAISQVASYVIWYGYPPPIQHPVLGSPHGYPVSTVYHPRGGNTNTYGPIVKTGQPLPKRCYSPPVANGNPGWALLQRQCHSPPAANGNPGQKPPPSPRADKSHAIQELISHVDPLDDKMKQALIRSVAQLLKNNNYLKNKWFNSITQRLSLPQLSKDSLSKEQISKILPDSKQVMKVMYQAINKII